MMQSFAFPHFDLRRAGKSLSVLLENPDDLPEVFKLISALAGTAPHRLLRRFERSDTGARILRERPDILPTLADRAALRALPEGSLGRAYLAFVESEGISAEGIRDASLEDKLDRHQPEVFEYLKRRMRDTHDLWHTVTGYKGDVLGEASLLAFLLGQQWHAGVALIVATAFLKLRGHADTSPILEGFRRGRAAEFLAPQDWESLLALPLDEVRARLKLGGPPNYTPMRTVELRAQGAF